jgi:hypothetical protein
MDAVHRIHDADPARAAVGRRERADPDIAPDALVVLRAPRTLRGTAAIVRREVGGGWEVEVRTPAGTPMHLVLPRRALLVV